MELEQSVSYYREHYPVYERFTAKVKDLLKELLAAHDISFSTEHRTKDIEHFREKITRQGKTYDDPLNDITDLCGVRIILRRVSDVSKVVEIIKKEFTVDETNSVYKAEELNVDQFGYTSVHLVINLNAGRKSLTEWKLFKDLRAEIQVRTILQHAWAVISHTFDYKIGTDIPREFRRRLFRLSALFELADEELDLLVSNIEEKIESYKASLHQGNTRIELNIDSLRAYIETSDEVKYWIEYVRDELGREVDDSGDLSRDIRIAQFCGLTTIEDVNDVMLSTRAWGESVIKVYVDKVFEHYKVNEVSNFTRSGIVSLLIIIANAEKFTNEILQGEFGYRYSPILEAVAEVKSESR